MIRILTHNVYWFQGHPYSGDQPSAPVTGILNECLALYRTIGADLLCLQEIQSAMTAASVGAALEMESQYLAGGEFPQYGGCVIGNDLEAVDPAESVAQFHPTRIWQRVNVPTRDGLLRLVNVHSPSDRQLGAASENRRVAEFRAGLTEQPPVDIIVGDFNERPGMPVSQLLTAAGYVDCAAATGNGDRSTSIGGKRGDWIWIRAALAGKLKKYDVVKPKDFLSCTPGKQFISDHMPLWIDLDIER